MANSPVIFRLTLAAFIANASLCPCASFADEVVPAASAAAPGAMHHAVGHDGHEGDGATASGTAADHAEESCHTDTPLDECAMSAGLDLDVRAAKSERLDSPAAIADGRPVVPAIPIARAGPSVLPEPHRPLTGSPITRHDRLTI